MFVEFHWLIGNSKWKNFSSVFFVWLFWFTCSSVYDESIRSGHFLQWCDGFRLNNMCILYVFFYSHYSNLAMPWIKENVRIESLKHFLCEFSNFVWFDVVINHTRFVSIWFHKLALAQAKLAHLWFDSSYRVFCHLTAKILAIECCYFCYKSNNGDDV